MSFQTLGIYYYNLYMYNIYSKSSEKSISNMLYRKLMFFIMYQMKKTFEIY